MARPLRLLADQAFSRTAGAPLVTGNAVQLLKNGSGNYPAWLDAIRSAERWIHFESYILHDDAAGKIFADAMIERARAGVTVRLMVDWLGSLLKASPRFWRDIRNAGIDVRSFNAPQLGSPLGWMSRDHRKALTVDGRIAFVSGLCVGDEWISDPAAGRQEWRDTGVSIRGPAVADVEAAFADTWAVMGRPLPGGEVPAAGEIAVEGEVALRVIATVPSIAGVFKLDQLVASVARETLWVTDAYFVGVSAYVRALVAAAQDGVDVRMLVPGSGTDVAMVQRLTRAGYRVLLEGGVRIFEWNGPMVHAKTAVADGRWARVGSTNLNIQSWLGNWELDVAVEDEGFGREMHAMFEEDLQNSTEIVLDAKKVRQVSAAAPKARRWQRGPGGTRRAAAAGAMRLGRTMGAVITQRREVGRAEAANLFWTSLLALGIGGLSLAVPESMGIPIGVMAIWLALSGLYRAWRLWSEDRGGSA
jgi:cardiolipin synthase